MVSDCALLRLMVPYGFIWCHIVSFALYCLSVFAGVLMGIMGNYCALWCHVATACIGFIQLSVQQPPANLFGPKGAAVSACVHL